MMPPLLAIIARLTAMVVFLSGSSVIGYTQALPEPLKGNPYSVALVASVLQMEKVWGNVHNGMDYSHLIVHKSPDITDDLPTQFDKHSVNYLDSKMLIERYRALNKAFPVLEVSPIQVDGSRLKVTVTVSWFSYEHRQLRFGVSDWSNVEFTYDCGQEKFVLQSVKLGGV